MRRIIYSEVVYVDYGELLEVERQQFEQLADHIEYIEEQFTIQNEYMQQRAIVEETLTSICISILVILGAVLGSLIFRHLRK